MLTFDELFTFNCFSRVNSLMLKIKLRCLEINILKECLKLLSLIIWRRIVDEFNFMAKRFVKGNSCKVSLINK